MRQQHRNKHQSYRQTLKKTAHRWVVPSARNHFHPTLLRPVGLLCIALIVAFIPTVYNLTTAGRMQVLGYASDINVGDLQALGNQERANAGLGALSLNSRLSQAAYNKAQDMFANNYWAHNSPSGLTPWSFIKGAGYSYATAGENLAKNFSSSAGVMYGWMNSPSHKANVLGADYKDVGYAVVNGTLLGEETTLVVAMYGAPYVAPAPAPAQQSAPVAAAKPAAPKPAEAAAPPKQETTETPAPAAETPTTQPVTKTAVPTEKTSQKTDAAASTESTAEPAVEGIMTIAPIRAYAGLNWGQKASLFILSVLLLLFIMKHTIIWRSRKRGLRDIWLRAHPIAQGGVLVAAIMITLLSGTGSIL